MSSVKLRLAYEMGYGRGYQDCQDNELPIPNPYPAGSKELEQYNIGYEYGCSAFYADYNENEFSDQYPYGDDDYNPDLDDEYEPKV